MVPNVLARVVSTVFRTLCRGRGLKPGSREGFKVIDEPPTFHEPGERVLDDPAVRLRREALLITDGAVGAFVFPDFPLVFPR